MTQPASTVRPDYPDTPWQTCVGLRANAIDGAAALVVMEVLVDALTRLPEGRAALAAACGHRAARQRAGLPGATPVDIAAGALALALVEAASALDAPTAAAA